MDIEKFGTRAINGGVSWWMKGQVGYVPSSGRCEVPSKTV